MAFRHLNLAFLLIVGSLIESGGLQAARFHGNRNYSAAARQRMISVAQAQLASARSVLASALAQMSQAQSVMNSATGRISQARLSMETAKSGEHQGHNTLLEMQASLIAEAGPDSEIGKAHAALLEAEKRYQHEAKRVIESDEYKERVAAIKDPSQHLTELPKIREEMFGADDDYQNAWARLKIESTRFGQLRTEMVRNSPQWMSVSQEVRDAVKDQNHAEIEATNGGMAHMSAWYRVQDAKHAAAAAQMVISHHEALLRRLGVNPNAGNRPSQPSGGSGS